MRYGITMSGPGRVTVLNDRTVRYVQFQNVDGSYPADATEVTDDTWAACYSSASVDKRRYIGTFRVSNVADIANEIDERRKATQARTHPSPRMPIGARSIISHHAPLREGNGSSRSWRRNINGTMYAFTMVTMPNGESRWFVNRYNGYVGGPQYACAWSRVKAIIIRPATCAAYSTLVGPCVLPVGHSTDEHETADGCYFRPVTDAERGRWATTDTREMCAAPDDCPLVAEAYMACCGAPLCSNHSLVNITGACPWCGRVAYPPEIPEVTETFAWFGPDAERPGTRDVSRFSVRYGVMVEWENNGISRGVIGSHDTWEKARHERNRLMSEGRWDVVRGVIALYATENDV